jgi:hypothetical protein
MNQAESIATLAATITKPFTGKMSTLRTARYSMGAGVVPHGAEIASLMLQFVTQIGCLAAKFVYRFLPTY